MEIPAELTMKFNTISGRKELIRQYGHFHGMYVGSNEDGEEVQMSIDSERGIDVRTKQSNGWIRVNHYDTDGVQDSEGYEGRWTENS